MVWVGKCVSVCVRMYSMCMYTSVYEWFGMHTVCAFMRVRVVQWIEQHKEKDSLPQNQEDKLEPMVWSLLHL